MASMEPDDDPSVHRLEGSSGNEKGGLVIMKKGPSADSGQHVFLPPPARSSLLGLDRLAAVRRKQQEDEDLQRKSHISSYHGEEEDIEDEDRHERKGNAKHDR